MSVQQALIDAGIAPADLDMFFSVLEEFSLARESFEQRAYRVELMLRVFLQNEQEADRLAPFVAQAVISDRALA